MLCLLLPFNGPYVTLKLVQRVLSLYGESVIIPLRKQTKISNIYLFNSRLFLATSSHIHEKLLIQIELDLFLHMPYISRSIK